MSKQKTVRNEDDVKDAQFDAEFNKDTNTPVTATTTIPSKEKVTTTRVGGGPRILAVVDDSRKSKLMLAELKQKGINPATTQSLPLKNVNKEVQDFIEKEQNKNIYDVVYLPVTNTDINKDKDLWKLRGEAGLPVNFYFDGHDDAEVNRRIAQWKIE